MSAVTENTLPVRQIQGIAILLSCLPADGKLREFFTLALDAPHNEVLGRIEPPADPDSDEGYLTWLEGLWGADDSSAGEKRLVDWQANPDNMTAAVAELKAVAEKLRAA